MMEAILNHQRPVLKVGSPPNLNLNWEIYRMQRLANGFLLQPFVFRFGIERKQPSIRGPALPCVGKRVQHVRERKNRERDDAEA